jgi:hypothetical protein
MRLTWLLQFVPPRADFLLAGVLASGLAVTSWMSAAALGPAVLAYNDVWFEADILRVYSNMSSRWSDQWRLSVHPLFSLLVFPPVKVLRLLGLDSAVAVRAVIAGTAAAWIVSLFALLRVARCRRGDALLFTLIGALSAGSLIWFSVPETYPFGSLSILWALGLAAGSERRRLPATPWVIVSALTLSFTITNWMAGIVAAAVSNPWRRAAQLTANAFCLVVLLWAAEVQVFPKVPFFLTDQHHELPFMLPPGTGGTAAVARAFIYHPMVMPAIKISERREPYPRPSLNIQGSPLGSGGWWGAIATGLWTVVFGLGVWTVVKLRALRPLRHAVVIILLGQFGLHSLYGAETFLYSLHWLPLLLVMVALTTLTHLRPLAVVLAAGLLVAMSINNLQHLHHAVGFVRAHPMAYFDAR